MHKTNLSNFKGFTIIELLIVIVIIAILAAITLVAYNSIQERANSTTLQSDLTGAKKKLMIYQISQGSYPDTVAKLNTVGVQASKSAYDTGSAIQNFYYCLNKVTGEFALGARTASTKTAWIITSSGGLQSVSVLNGNSNCQAVGLTGYADSNAFISSGFVGSSGWASWVY